MFLFQNRGLRYGRSVGFSLFLLLSLSSSHGEDLGYRLKDGHCQKNGAYGFNWTSRGECGQSRNQVVFREKWEDLHMAGSIIDLSSFQNSTLKKVNWTLIWARFVSIIESQFIEMQARQIHWAGSLMKGAVWKNSHLQNWQATGVRMEKTKFIHCDLRGANFWGSLLLDVDFSRSDLRGANFMSTFMAFVNFKGAKFDSSTLLPFPRKKALEKGMIPLD